MPPVSFEGIQNLTPDLQRAFVSATQAERKPIQKLEESKGKVDARVKLTNDVIGKVDALKGMMPGLDTAFAIRELTVGTSDAGAMTGTADKKLASPGTHNIEILQLASSASAMSTGFPDKDKTTIGSGYFSFGMANGETKEFYVDEENATLDGLARIINGARLGIKASVVNDQTDPDYPYRLVLVGDGTGTPNGIEYPEFYFMDGQEEFEIEFERPAQNGIIRYEGQEIQVPANDIADMIPGVTVNLKGLTGEGRPASLTVTQDIPKTTEKVKGFVDKLNGVFSFIQQQNTMDEKTDSSVTLGGEYSLRVAEQRLRSALSQNRLFEEGASIRTLSDLGIEFQKTGTLKFDEKKFEAVINARYDEVVHFLTGDEERPGIITSVSKTLNTLTGAPTAVLTGFKQAETDKINRLQKDIEKREKIADKKTEDLKMKLARMQSSITAMQKQQQSLAANGLQSSGGIESLLSQG